MQFYPICLDCKHFNEDGSWSCKAYPQGIPDDIKHNPDATHKKVRKDQDNEITFEPREDAYFHT